MKYPIFCLILSVFFSNYVQSMTIHVVGDSHAFFCFNNTLSGITKDEISVFNYNHDGINLKVPFYIHWLGSRTMFRVGRDSINGLNVRHFSIKEGDVVVFVFGEIDVRIHIGSQRDERRRDLNEIISTLVDKYMKTILANKKQYTNLTCVVASVMPPSDNNYNPVLPYHGSLGDRVKITQLLNQQMKQSCQMHDLIYLDIYSLFASHRDGSLITELSDGIVHVHPSKNRPIKDCLINHLLKTREL